VDEGLDLVEQAYPGRPIPVPSRRDCGLDAALKYTADGRRRSAVHVLNAGCQSRHRANHAPGSEGDQPELPSVASLAAYYGVARSTVISALRRMEADGLVEIVANWGTFRRLEVPTLLILSLQSLLLSPGWVLPCGAETA